MSLSDDGANLTGGRILVDFLERSGVRRICGVPGESFLAVLDALVGRESLRFVTCRHESGAAMMADAEARLTGSPGVAFVTRGPGATNASAGLHIAAQDSVPLVLLVGQVERGFRGREAFQEIDYPQFFGGLAKWVGEVDKVERLPELLQRAFATASAGRPGPVVLSLPEDILTESAHVLPSAAIEVHEPTPPVEAMHDLRGRLLRARRPLLVLGGGGWSASSWQAIQRFVETFRLPVAVTFRRQGLFDNRHPCYAGHLGLRPHPELRDYAHSSDLLLVVGSRLSEASTGGYELIPLRPTRGQTLVHLHNDPEELGRVYHTELAIITGMRAGAKALADLPEPETAPVWLPLTEDLHAAYLRQAEPPKVDAGAVDFAKVMGWLTEHLSEDAIVTNGAGNYAIWVNRFHAYRRFGSQLAPCSGSMGYGLPAAIAAKLAARDRPAVAFAGDGCFLMTGQELATAVQENLQVVVVVVNNRQLGTIRMHQERAYPGRAYATALTNPDFVALAQAFGAHGERVTRTEDFPAAFDRAGACGGPALIELMLDPDQLTPDLRADQAQ